LLLQFEPLPVALTSMLSPGAAERESLAFERLRLLEEVTVQESSVAPVVLSITDTSTLSLLLSVALVSAYRLFTISPLAGAGPASRLLSE
jgi:hypothetical protein